MNAPEGVLYVGVLMAVALGMTAWRLVGQDGRAGRVGPDVDRALGACLVMAVGLFIGVLAPYYLPGLHLP